MAMKRRLAALLLGLALTVDAGLAACAKPDRMPLPAASVPALSRPSTLPPTASAARSTAASGTTRPQGAPSGSASASAPPAGDGRLTLAFAGDVHFERDAARLLTNSAPLSRAVRNTLGRADFAMVNLETALGDGGSALVGKRYTFRAPTSALATLADAGVDAVSMANNHATDYGDAVFAQTLSARAKAPIAVVGVGRDAAEAFTPLRVTVGGVRVAVLASSQIRDVTALAHSAGPSSAGIATNLDPRRLLAAVRAAKASSDLVVVMLHWGTDYTRCADPAQRKTARRLADAGADVIVGGHAHRPQGAGWLAPGGGQAKGEEAYVAYGLGNFVWYNNEGASAESGVLTLTVDTSAAHDARRRSGPVVVGQRWTPMLVGDDGVPRAVASAARRSGLATSWQTATRCAGLANRPG